MATHLSGLKDPVVNVICTNNEGIPSSYRFGSLNFNHKNELEVEVPIKNKTKNINIQVTAHVKRLNGQK